MKDAFENNNSFAFKFIWDKMLYDRFHLNHPEIPFIIEFTPFFAILIAVVFSK